MKTKSVPSASLSIAGSTVQKHVWAALGASAFAIILSCVIAFNNVDAAPAAPNANVGGNQAATKADVERVMQRLGKIDRALEEVRMLVARSKTAPAPAATGTTAQ